ncbi:MAG: tRNA pseudouridine(55) synthase TruB [Spirochaetales bacterium]|nr:tRNA pseudouridine(55) synthase TruB [Spirochaetales bacterium]
MLDKKKGVTSHTALSPVKKKVAPSAVGHTGTLDKFAEGLMIVLIGPCTKFAPLFTGQDKEYLGLIEFGRETDTLDPEGKLVAEAPCPDPELLSERLDAFRGAIQQVPPAYSALHINGERAYKKIRNGTAVKMPLRNVHIHTLELLSYDGRYACIRVECSKGTYIRSLARDIGIACNSRASLAELKRTRVGNFRLDSACTADSFNPDLDIIDAYDFLSMQEDIFSLHVNRTEEKKVRNGTQVALPENCGNAESIAVFTENNSFLAFGHRKAGKLVYNFVIPAGWPADP